jgi:hypothetical protein
MKGVLLILLATISISSLAQKLKIKTSGVVFEKPGYIGGIRLDSIESEYAEVNLQNNYIYFDYGQQWVTFANYRLTDATGNLLRFDRITISAALNFMSYNGWEFVNSYQPQNAMQYFIFRKKKQSK